MEIHGALTDPKRVIENSPLEIRIEHPRLWWPNGYGAQDLYTVKVILYSDGREIDSWEKRIGPRTMAIAQKERTNGASALPMR